MGQEKWDKGGTESYSTGKQVLSAENSKRGVRRMFWNVEIKLLVRKMEKSWKNMWF